MPVAQAETLPTIDHKPHAAFFRQSGWLMVANILGGMMTYLVHFLNKVIDPKEYSAFGVLLTVVSCLPTIPLTMVFTQQCALAVATGKERQLAGMIRKLWVGITMIWVAAVIVVFIFHKQIVTGWHLPQEAGLWVTMIVVLMSLWSPIFTGMLQGRQDFFWVGWAAILAGAARLIGAVVLVMGLAMGSVGMIGGATIGIGLSALIAIWRTRDFWTMKSEPFEIKGLLIQTLPLFFGFGACQFMFSSDTMFATAYFDGEQMKPYIVAGTLSRALLWLVMPLASVMFPKLVHSNVKGQKSNLFGMVVIGTAVLSVVGALGLWITGPLVVRIMCNPGDVPAVMALIPWYAGAMVPLAMANVMVNDLMARARFTVVPLMVLLALVYGFTLPWMLNHYPGHIEVVLQTLGAFNFLLFLLCAYFTWGVKARTVQVQAA